MACADCVSGNIHTGTPVGEEVTLAGLSTYATGDASSNRIVIFGIDIFGWRFVNTRLLADEYAKRGFRVYIPDLFDGYELPQWTLNAAADHEPTFTTKALKMLMIFVFVPFVLRNSKSAQSTKIGGLLAHLRGAHPSAKIGFVGYCWGGRYALTMNPQFDATVAAHPSLVKFPAELEDIGNPVMFLLAANDHGYDGARGRETEKILKGKGLTEVEMHVYDGVNHGWTLRCNMEDPKQKAAREEAKERAIGWFEKYLVVESES
ncbi:hypothetical protein POSPLADRAFT_1075258 [Postia placenta MAD-698-R-SB12]|uniref:Dienelactone hydrolase domain-containing protein n=1 Tax=Postia placenta MAD-698-R-SB12 TaxID=670580 RepID=A0A1X6MTR3_9APHY|nr:hypothetical protein POSPLADRAFT_1075258 [Postia placenta MAD-698-R-SB12]OSX59650.1 hypothetical protein POSPLADRAFT_1075258 [Postia placenta MAD-698-R-SB12]